MQIVGIDKYLLSLFQFYSRQNCHFVRFYRLFLSICQDSVPPEPPFPYTLTIVSVFNNQNDSLAMALLFNRRTFAKNFWCVIRLEKIRYDEGKKTLDNPDDGDDAYRLGGFSGRRAYL